MLNQVILVGRISTIYEFKNNLGELDECLMSICVEKGCDLEKCDNTIEINLGSLREQVAKYCEVGMTIGVKARLMSNDGIINVVAEKVTFINSKE